MNNTFSWILILVASVGLISCTQEVFNEKFDGDVSSVVVIGPDDVIFEDACTKGTEITPSDVLRFSWSQGDTLGIFPDQGNQVEFPITSSDGGTSAVFNGGGWALKNLSTYAAYYPFSVWNYHRNNKKILLDYSGQVQNGNGSYEHLSAYDFLASSKTTPMNSEVTFQMNRQGSILYIDIVVPDPCTVNSLVVSCDEEIFVEQAALDISGDAPSLNHVKMTKELTLQFKGVTTTQANENVRAYMAVSPVDFTNKTVTATLYTDLGSYSAPVVSRKVEQGKAAFLRFAEAFTPPLIHFADPEVKRICVEVAGWDTDGDGELSYNEAAAVTSLKKGTNYNDSYFYNSTISSFDELQYFTGLTSIESSAFLGCRNLTSIIIPESVTTMETTYKPFNGCPLASIVVSDNNPILDSRGNCNAVIETATNTLICGCKNTVIPNSVTSIGPYVFQGCSDLTTITIPGSVTSIGKYAFEDCGDLTSISIDALTPPVGGPEMFSYTNDCPIYVPAGTAEAYKNAEYWSDYADRIMAIPEIVDLGLSVKWASFNLGASAPEEYGNYYSWGEVAPKERYDWETYKWCGGSGSTLTKYNSNSSHGGVDNKGRLDMEDDAANYALHGNWRMPTLSEIQELMSECTWIPTSYHGVDGYLVFSNKEGYQSKRIFLPDSGYKEGSTLHLSDSNGFAGYYWTSEVRDYYSANQGSTLYFYKYSIQAMFARSSYRYLGLTIRPVWKD